MFLFGLHILLSCVAYVATLVCCATPLKTALKNIINALIIFKRSLTKKNFTINLDFLLQVGLYLPMLCLLHDLFFINCDDDRWQYQALHNIVKQLEDLQTGALAQNVCFGSNLRENACFRNNWPPKNDDPTNYAFYFTVSRRHL